jgi:hypothetical protein
LFNQSQKSKEFVRDAALDNEIGGRTDVQNSEAKESEGRERGLKVVKR